MRRAQPEALEEDFVAENVSSAPLIAPPWFVELLMTWNATIVPMNTNSFFQRLLFFFLSLVPRKQGLYRYERVPMGLSMAPVMTLRSLTCPINYHNQHQYQYQHWQWHRRGGDAGAHEQRYFFHERNVH